MLGKLNETEIDNILLSQSVGRIACTDGIKPYIVPVTYRYDGKKIFGQTKEGIKLKMLRKNPNVCFEVDIMVSMNNWKSVIVSGIFRELEKKEAEKAREYLFRKVFTLMTSSVIHGHEHEEVCEVDDSNRIKPVMYQIEIEEKTGRYEKE